MRARNRLGGVLREIAWHSSETLESYSRIRHLAELGSQTGLLSHGPGDPRAEELWSGESPFTNQGSF